MAKINDFVGLGVDDKEFDMKGPFWICEQGKPCKILSLRALTRLNLK